MKFLKTLFLLLTVSAFSQSNDVVNSELTENKNEIRFDALHVLYNKQMQISYERQLSNRFSLGISGVFFNNKWQKLDFENYLGRSYNSYQFIPYTRFRISPKTNSIFFGEINANINGGKIQNVTEIPFENAYYYKLVEKNYTNFGLGLSVGFKRVFWKNFVFTVYGGGTQNINRASNTPKVMPRIGTELGFKF